MQQEYKYNGKTFEINTIACDDGDVIFSIGKYPMTFTFYLHMQDAERLAEQIGNAIDEAQRIMSKEAA